MKKCIINLNQELNGIELSFESKPERATLDAIKAQGFRWNSRKAVWYAKQTADRLIFAETLGTLEEATNAAPTADNSRPAFDLSGLGSNFCGHYGGAELSKAIREDLKRRGVKGCTVKCNHYDGITVTVKATPDDFASVEEFKNRYTFAEFSCDLSTHGKYDGARWIYSNEFETMTDAEKETVYNSFVRYEIAHRHDYNNYHRERKNYPQYTTAFCEKLEAVYLIANQWNYDNSDPYTDYFDRGYYLDIDIKAADFEPRENMTEAEQVAYNAEVEKEAEERAAALARYEEEQRKAEEAAKIYEEKRKQAETTIYNDVVVEDLSEPEQLFVSGLIGGIGKECNLDELRENSEEKTTGAVISRKVIFSSVAAFDLFGEFLLNDWIFLAGKGGTSSEDVRLADYDEYMKLTPEQRETIAFYYSDCVGVYVGDVLRLVIDPEGYNYARYTYIADNAAIIPAPEALEAMRHESEAKAAFYIPAAIDEQINNIKVGDEITIYMSDGWILTAIESGRGEVQNIRAGEYAQYTGYFVQIGGKEYFLRDNKEILIYKGVKSRLPQSVTTEKVSENMHQILTTFDGLFDRVYNYYLAQGETPILDTIAK